MKKLFLLVALGTLLMGCKNHKSSTELFAMEQQWQSNPSKGFDSTALEILNGYTSLAEDGDEDAKNKKAAFEAKLKKLVETDLGNLRRIDSVMALNQTSFNSILASSLSDACLEFAGKHPCSAKAPNLLLKGADLQRALERFAESEKTLQSIIEKYPNFNKADVALFFKANMQLEQGKKEEAQKTFQKLVSQFPKSEFARDAQILLDNNLQLPEVGKNQGK
jgi:tetratricopeptide (TPR) repeat protein